jgi:hypothetical protein
MSIFDYLCDSDWLQRDDINNLQRSSHAMRSRLARDGGRIRNLEDEIDHLTLINEALLRLLEKKGVIVRDEFRSLLVEVDLEDGVHDGKLAKPGAARPERSGLTNCRFCSAANDPANKFCSGCRRPLVRSR